MSNVRIGEICYVFDGPHATPTKIQEGPIYLGIDAITEDGRLNPAEYNHLSEEDYKKEKEQHLQNVGHDSDRMHSDRNCRHPAG